jgi:hypothetical protein
MMPARLPPIHHDTMVGTELAQYIRMIVVEELASDSGGAVSNRPLRRHLYPAVCPGRQTIPAS